MPIHKSPRSKRAPLQGVRFLVDESGKKEAVVIDLKKHRRLWEDFYDLLVSESRRHEPTIPWEDVKAELRKKKLLK